MPHSPTLSHCTRAYAPHDPHERWVQRHAVVTVRLHLWVLSVLLLLPQRTNVRDFLIDQEICRDGQVRTLHTHTTCCRACTWGKEWVRMYSNLPRAIAPMRMCVVQCTTDCYPRFLNCARHSTSRTQRGRWRARRCQRLFHQARSEDGPVRPFHGNHW